MSVSSYVGGGRHGHLIIIITNEEYLAIAADVFPVPDNPGASPKVVVGTTAAVIAELTRLHREATQVYRTYHNMDQAIKKLILKAFDDAYLNALSNEVVGYANCTSLDLLTHPLMFYVLIPHVRPAHKYPNSPWETIQPPWGDNAECVYPHKVYTDECNNSLTATYQCKTPIPSNKLLVNNILTSN
jgi:hypothetical protein